METKNEKQSKTVITQTTIQKMIEWAERKESSFIKADPNFWTVDRYYLLLCLKLGGWLDAINSSAEKQISLNLSHEVGEIVNWFVKKYSYGKN